MDFYQVWHVDMGLFSDPLDAHILIKNGSGLPGEKTLI